MASKESQSTRNRSKDLQHKNMRYNNKKRRNYTQKKATELQKKDPIRSYRELLSSSAIQEPKTKLETKTLQKHTKMPFYNRNRIGNGLRR
jgi:hypothetical protein